MQIIRLYAHVAGEADKVFKAKGVFGYHQLLHIQAIGTDGLVYVYAVAADGGRNAGADGFTTGISVAGVDGQRVAVAKHARVNVAEHLLFGKIGGVAAGIQTPGRRFCGVGSDGFAILEDNIRLVCGLFIQVIGYIVRRARPVDDDEAVAEARQRFALGKQVLRIIQPEDDFVAFNASAEADNGFFLFGGEIFAERGYAV